MMRTTRAAFAAAAAAALLWTGVAQADPPAHAKAWGHVSRQDGDRYDDDRYGRYDRDERYDRDDRYDRGRRYDRDGDRHRHHRDCDHRDWRHDHDRYDARPVYVVQRLPRGYRYVDHRGLRYYYHRHDGWYRPYGRAYARVAPPVGLIIDSRGIAVVADVPIVRW